MQVIGIVWDGLVEGRNFGVDEQMMMAGVRPVDASGCDAHIFQSEVDCGVLRHCVAIMETHEIDAGAGCRWCPLDCGSDMHSDTR